MRALICHLACSMCKGTLLLSTNLSLKPMQQLYGSISQPMDMWGIVNPIAAVFRGCRAVLREAEQDFKMSGCRLEDGRRVPKARNVRKAALEEKRQLTHPLNIIPGKLISDCNFQNCNKTYTLF